jgi:hypothetical protein
VAKRRTTLYIDEEVLRAAKVMAARRGQRYSELCEEALRAYTGFKMLDLLDEVGRRADLNEEDAQELANDAVHNTRTAR